MLSSFYLFFFFYYQFVKKNVYLVIQLSLINKCLVAFAQHWLYYNNKTAMILFYKILCDIMVTQKDNATS